MLTRRKPRALGKRRAMAFGGIGLLGLTLMGGLIGCRQDAPFQEKPPEQSTERSQVRANPPKGATIYYSQMKTYQDAQSYLIRMPLQSPQDLTPQFNAQVVNHQVRVAGTLPIYEYDVKQRQMVKTDGAESFERLFPLPPEAKVHPDGIRYRLLPGQLEIRIYKADAAPPPKLPLLPVSPKASAKEASASSVEESRQTLRKAYLY